MIGTKTSWPNSSMPRKTGLKMDRVCPDGAASRRPTGVSGAAIGDAPSRVEVWARDMASEGTRPAPTQRQMGTEGMGCLNEGVVLVRLREMGAVSLRLTWGTAPLRRL